MNVMKQRSHPERICRWSTALIMTLLVWTALAGLTFGPVNGEPPVVIISYPVDEASFRSNEYVELNASDSFDPDGKGITIQWRDSKDGSLGVGSVLMVKLSPGGHVITCEVTDGDGEKTSGTRDVTILVGDPPIARIDIDKTVVQVFEIITVNGSRSVDPDLGITAFMFDFGDGYNTGWLVSTTASHSYSMAGQYRIRLDVKDTDSLTASSNVTVEVRNRTHVEDNTYRPNVFMVSLVALLIIILIIIIVIWNRTRVRRKREEVAELVQRRRNPEAFRVRDDPYDGMIRPPPAQGQARKVRQPVQKELYEPVVPRKVRPPARRGQR